MDSVQISDSYTVCSSFNLRKTEDPLVSKGYENTVCFTTKCVSFLRIVPLSLVTDTSIVKGDSVYYRSSENEMKPSPFTKRLATSKHLIQRAFPSET
jgi:hypothetical protein